MEIRPNVPGPGGSPGFRLTAPPNEALEWDLENEITSLARARLDDGGGWWIAESYRATVDDILARQRGRGSR